jgi:triosephosphate isomerase
MRKPLVVGNWKMNGHRQANADLLLALCEAGPVPGELVVCPPALFLADVQRALAGSQIQWGAQDCSAYEPGAYTGEVAAVMLKEFGCSYVIIGHSERRVLHGETDSIVAEKAKKAIAHKLTPIVCVGETLIQRESGQTAAIVKRQLSEVIHALGPSISNIVVAYEPIWAIGTGRTATPEQAQEVHALLRAQLAAASSVAHSVRLLYGGSMKPDNAAALLAQPDIDGGLVGGAALKALDFLAIARAVL